MDHAAAAWVPPEVLVGVLALALGALFKIVLDRAKKSDQKIEELTKAIIDLDKRHVATATVAMLGSMGDRLDGRITNIAQDLAVLKAVTERDR